MEGSFKMVTYLLLGLVVILGTGLFWANSVKSSERIITSEKAVATASVWPDDNDAQVSINFILSKAPPFQGRGWGGIWRSQSIVARALQEHRHHPNPSSEEEGL